jgi:hypothetical protein
MSIPINSQLRVALSHDLNKSGSKPVIKVVDDATRKTFTANKDGAILEFAHKHASGARSKVRFPRTQCEAA